MVNNCVTKSNGNMERDDIIHLTYCRLNNIKCTKKKKTKLRHYRVIRVQTERKRDFIYYVFFFIFLYKTQRTTEGIE